MRHFIFFILISLFASSVSSQNNTFPSNGNVGISTTSPVERLQIGNAMSFHEGGHSIIGFNYKYRLGGSRLDPSKYASEIRFNPDNGDLSLGTTTVTTQGPSTKLTVARSGNVGIGTTAPTEKLQVNGLIRISAATGQDNNSPGLTAASNDDFIYDGAYINQYGFGFHGYQDGSTSFENPLNSYVSGHFGIDFFTGSQNRMRISNQGEVSIGTPLRQIGYKLAVNGKIRAKEIKVDTGWADYVFAEDYQLPSLDEVEQHIKEKGHLINIPSEDDVIENGIYLGEMNAKLLEKIEELTLYVIAINKEVKILKEDNISLKKILNDKVD